MKSTEIGFAGADIIGKRYVLCVIDHEGKHPRYARGRSDTVKGREKFFATIPPETPLMIVESELAVLSLHLLGESRVYIQKETEGYAVWERAGVNRGERMAIFCSKASLLNFPADSTYRETATETPGDTRKRAGEDPAHYRRKSLHH